MNRRLVKIIIALVSLLFLNIEAAHAGLTIKLKDYIGSGLSPFEIASGFILTAGALFLLYVIFTPLRINNQRLSWYSYFTFTAKDSVREKRKLIEHINGVLRERQPS